MSTCPGSGWWPLPEQRRGPGLAVCETCGQEVPLSQSRHIARHKLLCRRCGSAAFVEEGDVSCLNCGPVQLPLAASREAALRTEVNARKPRQRPGIHKPRRMR